MTPHRRLRRTLAAAVVAAATVAATLSTAVPAEAANPVTPGNFTGHGFDQCLAPSQRAMDTWLKHSPFLAVGIYIAGDSRGCRNQPNLTPTWISTQLRKGWRLLPITLGPQASCHPSFPRYRDDRTINPRPGANGNYAKARKQARYWAGQTVRTAQRLGIVKRSTLWYDLEGFDLTNTRCRESALAFLSAWTTRLHALDYVSGVYSSAGSGIKMLDNVRVNRPDAFTLPDRIWIARWDGRANTRTDYIRDDGWLPGGRMKQYRGGHTETWGGVTINIDSNWLDLGKGSWAARVEHCGSTRVDFRNYAAIEPGSALGGRVSALQCFLKESGEYGGAVNGSYNNRTRAAAARWQRAHGYSASTTWSRRHWMGLTATGSRPVLKLGSAGEPVRRVQRALNAASGSAGLKVTGVFNAATASALRKWQGRVDHRTSGIVTAKSWKALRKGRR
ncbi:glycoside hydrolase domain-containing protein [Nocardioides sp. GXQ0305]|uniref:glycoside hydrolase domain-containing protein n=1 Tax=Nocardioides sp. GXQ0305 TaxID=3423912 RepID=UPI003D7DEE56